MPSLKHGLKCKHRIQTIPDRYLYQNAKLLHANAAEQSTNPDIALNMARHVYRDKSSRQACEEKQCAKYSKMWTQSGITSFRREDNRNTVTVATIKTFSFTSIGLVIFMKPETSSQHKRYKTAYKIKASNWNCHRVKWFLQGYLYL